MVYREYWPIYIVDTDIPDWLEEILVRNPLWLLPERGNIARASLLAKIAFVEKDLVDRYCMRCSISPEVIGVVKEKVGRLKDIARESRNYGEIKDCVDKITEFPWERYCIKISPVACFVSQGVMDLNTTGKPTILISPERVENVAQELCEMEKHLHIREVKEYLFRTTIVHEIVHSYHYYVCEHNSPREVFRSSISDGYYTLGEEMLATIGELIGVGGRWYSHFNVLEETLVRYILDKEPLEYRLGVILLNIGRILERGPYGLNLSWESLSEAWVRSPSNVRWIYERIVHALDELKHAEFCLERLRGRVNRLKAELNKRNYDFSYLGDVFSDIDRILDLFKNKLFDRDLLTLVREAIRNKDYINAWKLMLLGIIDLLER